MKCRHCNRNWSTSNNRPYIFCPFCKEPLINVTESFQSLEDALCYLTGHYGVKILGDKQTVLSFIEVFLPRKQRERSFLRIAYDGGIIKAVLAVKEDLPKRQQTFLRQATAQFADSFGISEEWADYIMNCIAKSVGMECHEQNIHILKSLNGEKGEANEQFELALECLEKEQTEDYIRWITTAIELGSEKAAFHYGKYLFQKTEGQSEGERFLVQAMEIGNTDALCYLARYINELSKENKNRVEKFVEKRDITYDLLSVQQLLNLTFYFERQKDMSLAVELAERAYTMEPTIAWKRYIELLEKRAGSLDSMTAGRVYRQMAKEGNLEAVKRLAAYIESSVSSAVDMKTALYWYKIAANSGDIDAQLHLAEVYETGNQTDKDLREAVGWYEAAAANGSMKAYQKISFKNPNCIRKTVSLLMEDNSIMECQWIGYFPYQGKEYLLILDPESNENVPLLYREFGTKGDFEVEFLVEEQEQEILQAYRRKKNGSRLRRIKF